MGPVETRPFPGADLAARVSGGTDPAAFFEGGRRSVEETAAILNLVGRSFGSYSRILDFGAGCGRMLTWLGDVGAELHGTDTDADAIAWMRENLPFVEARTNEPLPPLEYPDGYFDLVYNHSVFTHIDERMQDAWLAELRRITRPGGHVVLTVHGEHAFSQTAAPPWDEFDRRGIVFVAHGTEPFPEWYGVTYHATWYVFARWSRWLSVRAYVPRGALGYQDMILLERRADGESDPYTRDDQPQATDALAAVEALLARGPDRSSLSRYGVVGTSWRKLSALLLRNYSTYQRDVDRALLDALRRLQR